MGDVERRNWGRVEVRAVDGDGDGPGVIVGHAAVFDSLSVDLGGFREKIDPGAFDRALKEDDPPALFNHDANQVLGRPSAGTARLVKDSEGIAYEIDVPDTQTGRDLVESIQRGDITGNSFTFMTRKDQWEEKEDGSVERTLLDASMLDFGPVTFPAYPQTDVAMRSMEAWRRHSRDDSPAGDDEGGEGLAMARARQRLAEAS